MEINHTSILKCYWSNDNEKITRDRRAGSEPIRGEKTERVNSHSAGFSVPRGANFLWQLESQHKN